ncbi:MAG: type 4a pilus biogenesis protein PilO [Pseudomonadales bacterium]|nr:type 4a pilus biogenesis protein PilO [Pseudomonadales bacterium]
MAFQDTLDQLQDFDFNDLDVSNVGAWPNIIKIILLVIIFVIILVAGNFAYLADKQEILTVAESKEVELKREYEGKAADSANLEEYRQQKIDMEATFGALLRQLPSDTEVPGLLEDITLSALEHNLKIGSIDLKAEKQAEFYVELPIDIIVEGTYHDMGAFVSSVAGLSRIVTLHNFTITPVGNASLKMSILAKTYRYLNEESK